MIHSQWTAAVVLAVIFKLGNLREKRAVPRLNSQVSRNLKILVAHQLKIADLTLYFAREDIQPRCKTKGRAASTPVSSTAEKYSSTRYPGKKPGAISDSSFRSFRMKSHQFFTLACVFPSISTAKSYLSPFALMWD